MLSRSAQGLYWMGRYLERARHLCVLLRLQVEALVDRPVREIYFGWSRIYSSMNRLPPGNRLQRFNSDAYTLADSYTLADDLTFERTNPDSVWSCFALGRENARQMRHRISAEMWTHLNLAYLKLQRLDMAAVWRTSPETFYAETTAEIDTLAGVAAATMYRDEGWSFMQLGRRIERAQLSVALLLAQLAADMMVSTMVSTAVDTEAATGGKEDTEADWTSLLRACNAFDAYNRRYSVAVLPGQVLELLATDPLLPHSLRRSIDLVEEELTSLGPGPDPQASAAAGRLAGRMSALINYDWPDRADRAALLQQAGGYCQELHHLVTAAYFDYPADT